MSNIWNSKIEEITSYTWDEVKDIFEILARYIFLIHHREYDDEIKYCLENQKDLVVTLPTKDLKIEDMTDFTEEESQKENAGIAIWMKLDETKRKEIFQKIPQTEIEELKEWNKRFMAGKMKAPLSLSQRLNISG